MSAAPSASSDTTGPAAVPGRNANTGSSRDDISLDLLRNASTSRTLDDVMREPSRSVPDVVVLDSLPEPTRHRDSLDLKEDLWLSNVDG
ncbi:hypothetical protein MYCTH_2295962 [Thermothelomyces thermophilus ATCC 42464]|uniref:Uncharacterized protein n=1 Tax=Thermothelomyces thermophilus (strain ATCC 42464 / BCRC 31852 / DSM 1799) TaxID=573729 RepID=G2PZV3_THET4|nr:uncharacterized protein MYCTH_2295962 [Thermothelomyces thermophilus ATCC 42464]AEO53976.1 hypothetical protein MYCTH_2295962 [Thermothelomyces thermophilus ATCC 42464]